MNFVLLGDDPVCLPLLRAIARAPEHELALAAHAGELWRSVTAFAPHARLGADWQALLIEPDAAAAIVAGHAPQILDGARALARAGIPLVVFANVRQTASFVYDLWPIEDEGRTLLIPLLSHDANSEAAALRDRLQESPLGPLRFLQLENSLAAGSDGRISLAYAENALLNDADLLRQIGGDYSRVTCVPVGLIGDRVAMMTVTLSGDGLPEATWSVAAAAGPAVAQLTISGERGSILHDLSNTSDDDPSATADQCLALVEHRLKHKSAVPRWSDVVRAFDLVDAARRSIRRRRTIEIGSEDISEVRQFKSLMTAAGCGVLMCTLFGVIAALLIGAVADPRDAAQRRAAAAGFIVRADEFVADRADLTPHGEAHVAKIAPRLWETTADVIVEPATPTNPTVDEARCGTVENVLQAADAANVAGRVVIRPLTGEWFEHAMLAVWVVVFAPLVVLLAMQLLGLVARSSHPAEPTPTPPSPSGRGEAPAKQSSGQ